MTQSWEDSANEADAMSFVTIKKEKGSSIKYQKISKNESAGGG